MTGWDWAALAAPLSDRARRVCAVVGWVTAGVAGALLGLDASGAITPTVWHFCRCVVS